MAIGKLNLKLGIDVSNLDKELAKVERSMSKFGNSMKNVGTTLSQSLTLPIVGLGAASLKAFAEMEKLEKGMTAIMGSSTLAKDEIVKLREVAKLPGLGLKEAVQGSVNLQAVGLSAEEAKNTLMGFGTALAATGKGKVELEAIQYQLTQMISKNKILAEDYKVIQSNLPLMAEGLKAAFGTTNIELIRNTGISAKDFTLQLSNALSLLPQTQNVTGGLANSFENLSDNIFISLNELGKTINETLKLEVVFDNISKKIQGLVERFKSLTPAQQENIVKFTLISAAVGPIILILGQLASSISSIITLSRTLIATFTILSGGTYLLIAAIGALVAYYATTDEGQKSLSKTGALLSGSIERLKAAFSKTLELLSKLQPLFDLLLIVFGKIAVFSFEIVLSQINAVLSTINFLYDGVVKVITALGLLDKTTVKPKIEMQWGGGSAGKPSGAGGSWGEETKKNTTTTTTTTTKGLGNNIQTKASTTLDAINEMQINKSMMEFEKMSVNVLPTLNLIPQKLESISAANLKLKDTNEALSNSYTKMTHLITSVEVALTPLQSILVAATDAFSNMAMQGETDMKKLGAAALQAARSIISAYIKEGVAGIIKNILAGPTGKALGPIALAVAGAAGAGAAVLFNTMINKVAAPKLAQGGLATGPTMAMVGDNRNARVDPEVIAPLSKLKSMMGDMGIGGTLETRISGNDLIILLNRSQKGLNRVQ